MFEACNNRYLLFTEWPFDAPLDLMWDAIFHAEASAEFSCLVRWRTDGHISGAYSDSIDAN